MEKRNKKRQPYKTILGSFAFIILLGTLLLWLPFSTKQNNLSFVDALFMSTSAICVTGLSVVENIATEFTLFGKIVLILLVEIGGLSFLTITIFIFILLGKKISMGDRFLMREALNQNNAIGIVKLVKIIILTTLSFQFVGVIINFIALREYYNFFDTVGISIFHSISSFNNAGFDIFGSNQSMTIYKDNVLLNINTMLLITFGGLGFVVLYDICKNKKWKKINLHTKIVLITSLSLIVVGTILFKLFQKDMTWLQSIFQSVTARTAGFASYDMSELSNSSTCLMSILMIIGASPCSTGGGIKTTTLFIVIITIINYARGKTNNVFRRKISDQSVFKAFSLVSLSIMYIAFTVLLLSLIETNVDLRRLFFETASAFGTVGLSMGLTPSLHSLSKIILCCTMFFGRLGPLTLISVWNNNWMKQSSDNVQYVEEKVIIG